MYWENPFQGIHILCNNTDTSVIKLEVLPGNLWNVSDNNGHSVVFRGHNLNGAKGIAIAWYRDQLKVQIYDLGYIR